MASISITETVLRDGNQSFMATRMPLKSFESILSTMDKAGYGSVECWGGATFDSCLRYLNEDPWNDSKSYAIACPILNCKCCCEAEIYLISTIFR